MKAKQSVNGTRLRWVVTRVSCNECPLHMIAAIGHTVGFVNVAQDGEQFTQTETCDQPLLLSKRQNHLRKNYKNSFTTSRTLGTLRKNPAKKHHQNPDGRRTLDRIARRERVLRNHGRLQLLHTPALDALHPLDGGSLAQKRRGCPVGLKDPK